MLSQRLSIKDNILDFLYKKDNHNKGTSVYVLCHSPLFFNHRHSSFNNSIHKLRKEEFIFKDKDYIVLLPKGRKYWEKKLNKLMCFESHFNETDPKKLLVMFDIPEDRKAEREWLRFHLKKFKYIMVQRSVWVGPSPLPKEFVDYTRKIKIKDCIKTFKLEKPYNT